MTKTLLFPAKPPMTRFFSRFSLVVLLALGVAPALRALPPAPVSKSPVNKSPVNRNPANKNPADESADWYAPKEEDFRPAYDRDPANQAAQPWKDYFGWVKCFYEGNLLDSGWTRRCRDLVSGVQKESTRAALRTKLNALGRHIAAEWAKASKSRKVDTSKLVAWGQRLKEAKEKDAGAGETIEKEIELIAKEVDGAAQ